MMSEMLQLIPVVSNEHQSDVRQLISEYTQLLYEIANQEYGVSLDMDATLELLMTGIDAFYPPKGRMYLCKCDSEFVGIGCLKPIRDEIGEVKRMFVQPQYRRKGIGNAILNQLIADARSIGYTKIRLDSPTAFSASHKLYQSNGFQYIDAYPGSEGAEAQPELFVYMELVL